MNKIIFILAITLLSVCLKAQTNLNKGDIAFIAVNSDGSEDDFSFLLMRDIDSGTSINFTDNGWTSAGNFNSEYTESHITWTSDIEIESGTVVQIKTFNGTETPTASFGNITGEKMTVSVAGDQVLAYQGDKSNPNFIAAISFNQNLLIEPGIEFDGNSDSNSTTAVPTGLSVGNTAIHIYEATSFSESDNAIYNCDVISGDKAQLLSAINNVNNWVFNNHTPFNQAPFPCTFTVDISTNLEQENLKNVSVFPNPSSSSIQVSIDSDKEVMIKIMNSSGNTVDTFTYPANVNNYTFNIEHLSVGIYYLQMRNGNDVSTTKLSVYR